MAVFATRKFKKGEEINLCRGGVADLTEEEDDQLRRGGQKADFSVLYSSRKKSFGLLLGPARFVNVSRVDLGWWRATILESGAGAQAGPARTRI